MFNEEALKTLKGIIRKEVKRQLSGIVKETVQKELYGLLAEIAEEKRGDSITEFSQPNNTNHKPKIKTGNPIIDSVLEETDGGVPSDPADRAYTQMINEYRNLMDKEMFTSGDMSAIMNSGPTTVAAPATQTTVGIEGNRLNTTTEAGKAVASALTRDYSELVKRFKK